MADLPRDSAEEILPVKSIRRLGSACKKSNNSSKDRNFTRKTKDLPPKLKMMSDLPRVAEEMFSTFPVKSKRRFRGASKKSKTLSKDGSFRKKHVARAKAATKELPAKLTMMSDLPRDLVEEVLCKLPVTSLRGARFTCKKWNTLTKDQSFLKKHIAASAPTEFMVVMVMEFGLYLMALHLHGIHKGVDPSINCHGKLISLDNSDRVDISRVYHCDGLLLCITKDFARFVVWNPCSSQTLWLKPTSPHPRLDWYSYAIGYENSKSCRSYKILRFVDSVTDTFVEYQIYELSSNSWKALDITSDWNIEFYARGVSLKGNTYWFAQEKYRHRGRRLADFLICFNFTTEKFGPRLGLPFHSEIEDTVTLSSVREEQLAVLFQREDTFRMELWVTSKIEPEEVSWNKLFLAVDMEPRIDFQFGVTDGSFFIDEENRVAMVFHTDEDVCPARNIAYIIGEGGYVRQVDLGISIEETPPLGCSYVPSLAQIK